MKILQTLFGTRPIFSWKGQNPEYSPGTENPGSVCRPAVGCCEGLITRNTKIISTNCQ